MRLIVEEWSGRRRSRPGGYIVNVRDVSPLGGRQPGGMAALLDVIEAAGVNIEYMYAFAFRRGEEAVLVFRFDNAEKAVAALKAAGLNVLGSVDLFQTARHGKTK